MSKPELLQDMEPASGYWESDGEALLFGPASAQILSALSCLRIGISMCWKEVLHEDGSRFVLTTLRQAAINGSSFSFNAQFRTALGTTRWVRVVGDSPRLNCLRGFLTDCSVQESETQTPMDRDRRNLVLDLESAQSRHRELFEGVPFPVICYDWESRRILDVNEQATLDYGYSLDEFLGLTITKLWPVELSEQIERKMARIDPTKATFSEVVHQRKDGTRMDVEVAAHPVKILGKPARVIVSRDVTESKRVERDLRLSNERLSLLAQVTGAVVGALPLSEQANLMAEQVRSAFKVDACVVRLIDGDSLALLATSGVSPDQLVDRFPCKDGFAAEVIAKGGPLAIFDVRETLEVQIEYRHLFEQYKFISYAGAPLLAKDKIIGIVGLFTAHEAREFTPADLAHLQIVASNMAVAVLNHELYGQLKDHRSTLEASEERLRLVTEASTDGIWEWDRASDSFSWSDRIFHLLGVGSSAMEPKRAHALEIVHPADRKGLSLALIRNVREHGAFRHEVRLRHGDGSFGTYEAYGKLVLDEADRPIRMVGSIHDISERVQRDRELEAVAAISLALREVETTQEMLPMISQQIARILGLQSLGVGLVDAGSDTVVIRHASGVFENLVGVSFERNEGLIGRVFNDAKVRFAPDIRDEPTAILKSVSADPTAVMGVPLVARGEVIGVLWLGKTAGPGSAMVAFNPGEARLLSILAEIAAASLRRAGLRERTEFHLRRLHSLSVIHASVSENRDLHKTLSVLLDQLKSQTAVDAAIFHVYDEQSTSYRIDASLGLDDGISVPPLGRELIVNRCHSQLTDLLESGNRGRRFAKMIAAGYKSYLAVPLIANEQIHGLLEIYHKTELPSHVDLDNFTEMLASQAAIAVDNTNLLKSLRSANKELTAAYDATIEGWARALDLRDHETEGHTRRVTEMTVALANLMGVPSQAIAHMRRGALLHDIGKMAIPDSVLLKPGELSQSEWVVMRRHPGIALDLLEPVSFLKPAVDIPFCHHEKWDGTGYPRGLKGKEIPLSARIFSVIDVWDALRSDRPYRKGWSAEQAVQFILVQSGRHFDPEVVEIFINNRDQIDHCCR